MKIKRISLDTNGHIVNARIELINGDTHHIDLDNKKEYEKYDNGIEAVDILVKYVNCHTNKHLFDWINII